MTQATATFTGFFPNELAGIMVGYVDLADEAIRLMQTFTDMVTERSEPDGANFCFVNETGLALFERFPTYDKTRHIFEQTLLVGDERRAHAAMARLIPEKSSREEGQVPFDRVLLEPYRRSLSMAPNYGPHIRRRAHEVFDFRDLRKWGSGYCLMHQRSMVHEQSEWRRGSPFFPKDDCCAPGNLTCVSIRDVIGTSCGWDGRRRCARGEEVVAISVARTLKRIVDFNLVGRAFSLYNSMLVCALEPDFLVGTVGGYALEKRRIAIVQTILQSYLLRFSAGERRFDKGCALEGLFGCIAHLATSPDGERVRELVSLVVEHPYGEGILRKPDWEKLQQIAKAAPKTEAASKAAEPVPPVASAGPSPAGIAAAIAAIGLPL